MPESSRRRFLGAAAALAGVRWEEAGYDPHNVEEWSAMKGPGYTTGRFETGSCSAAGHLGYTYFEDEECTPTITVSYGPGGPCLAIEGQRDDLRLGLLAKLPPEVMKQLAAALYQAAWESEHRPVASDERPGVDASEREMAEALILEKTEREGLMTADDLVAETEFDRQTVTSALVGLRADGDLESTTLYWRPDNPEGGHDG